MACEFCGRDAGHHPRCPNYKQPKASHYCSYCGEGIYDGEEYIENLNGEYRHCDCCYGVKDLLEWMGYEVKTMEESDERDF